MKITFTHLDTKKTPKTSDSLKPTPNKGRHRKNQTDQCCRHRPAKTWYGEQMMTSQDSQGEDKKLLRLHARTLTYTLNLQFVAKASLICESVRSLN